jgi:hypothetical protein
VRFVVDKAALETFSPSTSVSPATLPPTAPHTSAIIRGWYNSPNSGRRTKSNTESHTTPRNLSHMI